MNIKQKKMNTNINSGNSFFNKLFKFLYSIVDHFFPIDFLHHRISKHVFLWFRWNFIWEGGGKGELIGERLRSLYKFTGY